ncbi:hypothetical protein JHK82_012689 [Glycine max]|uniref:Uncharacterized protein n=2 Tax=Glycine subgen. Soja TaxID=1462606 RepID=A0A0R0K4C5_SOYBN|nr:hypothetical protein JHK85_013042 [Glycine max]RZC12062.1 hypothetical protein D0Y65_012037 [Glycine soja]KAG5057712.1 hypothetical protein JHK86_012708 [Glycine max]KAG5154720.1 hypothetical protein JHK82_012689 [Glycine max]KAH1133926.1 hypothetical protein GYH30_012366 [Glycine max]
MHPRKRKSKKLTGFIFGTGYSNNSSFDKEVVEEIKRKIEVLCSKTLLLYCFLLLQQVLCSKTLLRSASLVGDVFLATISFMSTFFLQLKNRSSKHGIDECFWVLFLCSWCWKF